MDPIVVSEPCDTLSSGRIDLKDVGRLFSLWTCKRLVYESGVRGYNILRRLRLLIRGANVFHHLFETIWRFTCMQDVQRSFAIDVPANDVAAAKGLL